MRKGLSQDADRNFILQQGLPLPDPHLYSGVSSALMFQPRVVGVWFLIGWALQSGSVILALAAALWWGALVPTRNLFDFIHAHLPTGRSARVRIRPAPAPRRFAQGLAGTLATAAGVSLLLGATRVAVPIAVFFTFAVGMLAFGRFCFGSFVYHLLRGRARFAFETLPWRRPPRAAGAREPVACGA